MPRYIIRIEAPIRGVRELPKTSTRSEEPLIEGLLRRKMNALMKVKASKPTPTNRVTYAMSIELSFMLMTSAIQQKMQPYNIKSSGTLNKIAFNDYGSTIKANNKHKA